MEEQHPTQEESQFCLNCGFLLENNPTFCQNCGQKNTDGRLTVKDLFSQFFDNVFNLDSKIFRTLIALLIPGKLTNAFLSGQRQKYYHPIRLFLVLIVIFLASLNFQSDFPMPTSLEKGRIAKLKERKRMMGVFDQSLSTISDKKDQNSDHETLDTLSKIFYKSSGKRVDSININKAVRIATEYDTFYIALEDFGKYSPDEILNLYNVKGFMKRLMVKQKFKIIEEGTNFIPFVLGKVTWVIFIVLLFLSFIFKLLYYKSDFLYLEHIIFGIHLNSFFLIIVSLLTLFPEGIVGDIMPWIFIVMAIYLFISLKRVYKQTYLFTSLKFILAVICYFFSFIFGFALSLVGSFLIF